MEQKEAERPATNFSQLSTVSVTDELDELLNRSKALASIIENNAIEECTAYQTLIDRDVAAIALQITRNLEMASECSSELWQRYRQATANAAGPVSNCEEI